MVPYREGDGRRTIKSAYKFTLAFVLLLPGGNVIRQDGDLAGKVWRFGLMGHASRVENIDYCLLSLKQVL